MSEEIDKLMAIEVMGYELVSGYNKRITADPDLKYYIRPNHALKPGEDVFHKCYIVCRDDFYQPTTNIQQAIECMDKSNLPMKITMTGNICVHYWGENEEMYIPVLADNLKDLPLTICKAILKAKGIAT